MYPSVAYDKNSRPVLVLSSLQFGRSMGYVNVTFNGQGEVVAWGGRSIQLDVNVPFLPSLMAKARGWEEQLKVQMDVVIGSTLTKLFGERPEVPRAPNAWAWNLSWCMFSAAVWPFAHHVLRCARFANKK